MSNHEMIQYALLRFSIVILCGVAALGLLLWKIERSLRTIQNVLAAAIMIALPHLRPEPPQKEEVQDVHTL